MPREYVRLRISKLTSNVASTPNGNVQGDQSVLPWGITCSSEQHRDRISLPLEIT